MLRVEHVMGFPVSVRIDEGAAEPEAAVDEVFAWLRQVDARFSPFKPDSEVSRLDRGEVPTDEISPELLEILTLCEDYRVATRGAFDARLPGRGLDPCAVVKGWSVQKAADLLAAAGATRFCVNAGGDVVASGGPWRVGVRHPEHADRLCTAVDLTEGAVATSARYERGDHILDGRTGRPVRGLLSLTVVAASLTEADATATAAFALGTEGVAWAAARAGCEVFAVDEEQRVLRTAGFPVAV
ncbi:FAD:protein FMN transferase [Streptomyces flavofungini]|uniref:FAD:protein FMN transferase n=1 Tax=Streptomyces flavofungini TaxID=68200 RepID=A0ABS0XBG6_9ACTN|nr:FAD:protein FMN transferase [Streptomyces flavofungini]MBJ3810573.1 FAD:protein FMN transferase [Streptomyces flavofungini]GHC83844.1 FAD:protein FMN transferase [Streptomyces flavofungini]